jgi:hypothetical protein
MNVEDFFATDHELMGMEVEVFDWGMVFKVDQKFTGCASIIFDKNL